MAITISANNANNDSVGIDVTAYFLDFQTTYTGFEQGFGWFSDNTVDYSGNQFANSEQGNLIPDTTKQSVVFESGGDGNSIDYNISTHVVGGDLDAITFGYGLAYHGGTDTFPLTNIDLRISGFGLIDQTGTNNSVYNFIWNLIKEDTDTSYLTNYLSTQEINFFGSTGDDVFTGYSQNDKAIGGNGNDTLNGGGGNDILYGGAGNDTLNGGPGNDTYVYDGRGADVIAAGFQAGAASDDIIQITKGFADFASVIAATANVGGNAVIDFGSGNTLTITGVTKESLHADDFKFEAFDDGVNDAPETVNDASSTLKNFARIIDVLANDSDVDGTLNPATVTIVTGPSHGSVSVNLSTGKITYTPTTDYTGSDSFTYTVKDNLGEISNPATVTLDVQEMFQLTAGDDVFSGDSMGWTSAGISVSGGDGHDYIVTSNSKVQPDTVYGGDGNDLIFTGGGNDYVDGGAGDDVIHARGGTETVIGGEGDDTFVIRFFGNKSSGTTDTGTTTIYDDDGVLWNGTFRPATYPGSWTPAPGATAGFVIAGGATLVSPGVFNLEVADDNSGTKNLTLNWTGGDLTITAGTQTTIIKDYVNGTFGITLPVPVVADDNVTVGKNIKATFDVLANDIDGDGGTLDATSVTIVDSPDHGSVSVNSTTGVITYTPTKDYVGADSFTYTVKDNDGNVSGQATVNIDVTGKLTLTGGDDAFVADLLAVGPVSVEGGAGDDYLGGSSNPATAGGDFFYGGDGDDVIFGASGDDYLDGGDGNDILRSGSGNDTLVGGAGDDTYGIRIFGNKSSATTDKGTVTIIDDDGVLWNGTIRNDPMPSGWPSGQQPPATAGYQIAGTATVVTPGTWNLEVADDNGGFKNLTLNWEVGGDLKITAGNEVVTIQDYVNGKFGITLENAGPVAADDATTTHKGFSRIIDVLANDEDVDGTLDPSTVTIVDGPDHGTYSINTTTGKITYTPTAGYTGSDSFTYTVKDNDGTVSNEVTVTIDVQEPFLLTGGDDVFSGDSMGWTSAGIYVSGGDGHDYIVTSNSKVQADKVEGGAGNDLIFTGGGNDYVDGGAGDDVIHARGGIETVIGGEGDDTFVIRFFGNKSSGTTDTGTTTIYDDDGVLWNGTFRPATYPGSWTPAPGATAGFLIAGTAAFVSEDTWTLTVKDDNGADKSLNLSWSGGDLTITAGTQTTIIKDYVNGTFGITLQTGNTISGTAGADKINGSYTPPATEAPDIINGNAGDDIIDALGGADKINGGAGKDTINGGDGNDIIYIAGAEGQNDIMDGGAGTDTLEVIGTVAATLAGFSATNSIEQIVGNGLQINGSTGNDTFNLSKVTSITNVTYFDGGAGNDTFTTGDGVDGEYRGGAGNDTFNGGNGNDTFQGDAGVDILNGGDGDDTLVISGTNDTTDTLNGGAGNDTIKVIGTTAVTLNAFDATAQSIEAWSGNGKELLGTATANTFDFTGLTSVSGLPFVNGGAGNDTLKGSNTVSLELRGDAGDDTLTAGTIGATLVGGAGKDTVTGGVGNDTIVISGTNDTTDIINGGGGTDTIRVDGTTAVTLNAFDASAQSIETWLGNNKELLGTATANTFDFTGLTSVSGLPFVNGGGGNDTLKGSDTVSLELRGDAGDDTLIAGAIGSTLIGGAGKDTVTGGVGNDTIVISGTNDLTDIINGGGGTDTIRVDGTTAASLTSFNATAQSIETWQGNNKELLGTAAADTLNFNGLTTVTGLPFVNGAGGNDVITGSDTVSLELRGDAGDDTLIAGAIGATLIGGTGKDTVTGGAGDDIIVISGTNDLTDVINGGGGTDTIRVDGTTAATLTSFNATAQSIETWQGNNKELLGTAAADTLNFNGLTTVTGLPFVNGAGGNDVITGSDTVSLELRGDAGDDTLNAGAVGATLVGGAGKDTLNGGAGDDTLVISGALDTTDILNGGGGTDTIKVAGTTAVTLTSFDATASSIEIWSGNGKELVGTAGADTLDLSGLTAVTGLPFVNGMAGNDVITGSNSVFMELRGDAGNDTLNAGAAGALLNGGAGDDTLNGGIGDDTFIGGAGADTIVGGGGIDTVSYAGSAAVVVNLRTGFASGGDATGDKLIGIRNVIGTSNNDTITASAAGSVINGGAGIDTLLGGVGDDTFIISGTNDVSDIRDGNAGNDTVKIVGGNATLNGFVGVYEDIENFDGSGFSLLGTATNNTFDFTGVAVTNLVSVDAGAGNDVLIGSDLSGMTLIGGAGVDTVTGGAKDDTIVVSGTNDTNDIINGGGGTDTLKVTGTTALTLQSFDASAQSIEVWSGNAKELLGTATANTFDLSSLTSVTGLTFVDGGAGNDVIKGTDAASLDLRGGAGDDIITAGNAGDTITGGAGKDTLTGGSGNDTFVISGTDGATDVINGNGGTDTIRATGAVTLNGFDTVASSIEAWVGTTKAGVTGSAGNETFDFSNLTSVTNLHFIDGGAGNDIIIGSDAWAGDLRGGAGNDTLKGGALNDTLTGGAGSDTFVFHQGGGADIVTDLTFSSTTAVNALLDDKIDLTDFNFNNYGEVQALMTQVGKNVLIDFGNGDTLQLSNTTIASLNTHSADFLL